MPKSPQAVPAAPKPVEAKRRLGYQAARELEALPAQIEALEAEIAAMTESMRDPAFYRRGRAAIEAHNQRLAAAQAELDAAYARWSELEH